MLTPNVEEVNTKPLVTFLQGQLLQLKSLFEGADSQLNGRLREYLGALRYQLEPDSPFQPFLLVGGQALEPLSLESLNNCLAVSGLPHANFMSQPPTFFDSVLVPIGPDVGGGGYLFFWSASLPTAEIYYLLAHAWGHLVLGHLRQGDVFSHWDVLTDLRHEAGSARRWDKAVQQWLPLWFAPLATVERQGWETVEWLIPGFSEAFERLRYNQLDDPLRPVLAAAQRYTSQLLQMDFDIVREANLFPHQRRGAVELALRLQRLGVALLADSVGLGKTRTTATLIRLLRQNNVINQAAILTPQKLEHNWRAEFYQLKLKVGEPGDPFADVVVVNKDKFKRLEPGQARALVRGCDLLIIEEAHQDLRNGSNKFHRNLREAAVGKFGLLVTATPWNNRRGDIYAMLYPFASNAFDGERPAHAWACFGKNLKDGQKEFENSDEIFRQVYALTALQRTRRQLRESSESAGVYYAPRRPYLVSVNYTPEQATAFTNLLEKIQQLRLPHVNFMRYLASDEVENYLSGFQRFSLLKRAESSMYAFQLSLKNLYNKTKALEQELTQVAESEQAMATWLRQRCHLEEAQIEEEPNREVSVEVIKPRYGSQRNRKLIEEAEKFGKLRAFRSTLLSDSYHDLRIIYQIQQEFRDLFTQDPKLDAVLEQVKAALIAGNKVLCISQYADTARIVYHHLLKQPLLLQNGIGFVTGGSNAQFEPVQINGKPANREAVLSRFAPTSWASGPIQLNLSRGLNQPPLPNSLAILVGSDTLSVGQNLQDARVLINLDLCWNPMQHEQRIGRIDRPRHASDSAPLDIFYFLNLELIESELKLRATIEKRLTATYQDTEFDDEILPGYFEMIEQFRRLRQEQPPDKLLVAEADNILQDIAERSARPPQLPPSSELERAALLQLREWTTGYDLDAVQIDVNQLLVSTGKVSLYDQQKLLHTNLPQLALVAELEFTNLDAAQYQIGPATYRPCYLTLHQNQGELEINLDAEHVAPVVEGLLSERLDEPLTQAQIGLLQKLLLRLQEYAQQELEYRRNILRRTQRRLRLSGSLPEEENLAKAQVVAVRLISLKCLVL